MKNMKRVTLAWKNITEEQRNWIEQLLENRTFIVTDGEGLEHKFVKVAAKQWHVYTCYNFNVGKEEPVEGITYDGARYIIMGMLNLR